MGSGIQLGVHSTFYPPEVGKLSTQLAGGAGEAMSSLHTVYTRV